MNIKRLLLVTKLFWLTAALQAQNGESPYFTVLSESPTGSFPLLSTSADVRVTGPIADVRIIQKYRNDGTSPIEALYVFPASTRAAVHRMEMHIGDRVVTAEIMERQAATQTYERAKQEGKRTSLLEQHRPNVFQMQVANIMPGEEIEVHLYYTELLIPEAQEYTFVYPTVVGPRYHSPAEQHLPAHDAGILYQPAGEHPSYDFDIAVHLAMPVPLRRIDCASHPVRIVHKTPQSSFISLAPGQHSSGNRDFILKYSLAGKDIASGVLTYTQQGERYVLCQIEPPKLDVSTNIVPREYIFVIDVSGSMHGYPLDISKELMRNLLSRLRHSDRFNILFFAGSSFMLSPQSLPVTKANVTSAFEQIRDMDGGGGTELLPALKKAMAVPKQEGYARSFVMITDGYVTVEEEAFQTVLQNLDKASFFAFGIGSGVNRFLIEGLAHVGRGEPFIVTTDKDARSIAAKFESYIEHPVLTDIHIDVQGATFEGLIPERIPDLMAARPIYFIGKYSGHDMASITVTGRQGNLPFTTTVPIPAPRLEHAALRYLWAREKIRFLDDFNTLNTTDQRIHEITQLGLAYNLLTRYTSFVAVDEHLVNEDGAIRRVKQPLPLPQGVSDYAVGFELEVESSAENSLHRIRVDVACDDRNVKLFVESVLEQAMEEKPYADLILLTGLSVEIELDQKGADRILHGDEDLAELVRCALQEAFATIGIPFKGRHVVRITVARETF